MESKTKKKCSKCGAEIHPEYDMCSVCYKKYNNEIIVAEKFNDVSHTVQFYKLKIIEHFCYHDKIILSFIRKHDYIADKVISEIRHMGIMQSKRYIAKVKSLKTAMDMEYIKAPLELIPAVRAWKYDIKNGVLRGDD
jgi:uncharacterized OB-fold protein